VQPLCKANVDFLKTLNIDLPNDPGKSLLVIYPKEYKSVYYKSTCTLLFIAVLFKIAKLWKQPSCSTIDEENVYFYKLGFYSVTKENEFCHVQVNG
jgi:hypothetical protein